MSRIRNVALLLLVLVLATGLASAQPGLKVTQVTSSGPVSLPTFSPGGLASRAPLAGKYWDALAGAGTDYYNTPQYINAPPNPQIAVGPDDIITIVNRTIARYPNPNAAGNATVANPYNYQPTSKLWLDTWLGITDLNLVCPTQSPTRDNLTCVIDNASVRYDQLQGRFVVLMTVTDVPRHISNFVLIVSRYAQLTQGATGTSQLFTAPIAPIVGGTGTGGVGGAGTAQGNLANWVRYVIPINVVLPATLTANTQFCVTPNLGGNPASLPLPYTAGTGPIATGCTDYFPTGARLGTDNDNLLLLAPVLDMSQAPLTPVTVPSGAEGTTAVPNLRQLPGGPFAGTRVVTIAKQIVYNGVGGGNTDAAPASALNLADDTLTGTLTGTNNNPAPVAIPIAAANTTGSKWCGGPTPTTPCNPIPPIYWEPNNLRGRALASFDSQVGAAASIQAGIITPIDYLVGTLITDDFGLRPNNTAALLTMFVQPIIFSCPGSAIYNGPSGVTFCGFAGGGSGTQGQAPEVALLGTMFNVTTQLPRNNVSSLSLVADPALVGQADKSSTTGTTGFNATKRLFVGDSRPQQVIFREGLLYIARAVRLFDSGANAMGSSTVMYDIVRQPAPTCTGVNIAGTYCASGVPSTYSTVGVTIPNAALVIETQWYNGQNTYSPANDGTGYGFYAPMYDTPANVVAAGPTSPISLFPWLEKLFVGMTTGGTANVAATFANNYASLWDWRPGDDVYDTYLPYIDPYTGSIVTQTACVPGSQTLCPLIPFGTRGGAGTDPNDGSLWLYGAFAKARLGGVPGPGVWGTSVSNYQLDFPVTDPYSNDNTFFTDVQPTGSPASAYFTWIQIAKNLGIYTGLTSTTSGTTCTPNNNPATNPPILQPPAVGGTPNPGTGSLTCTAFGPDVTVTRSEMARWVVLGQMDENQVNAYLAATGGIPGCVGLTSSTNPAIGGGSCKNTAVAGYANSGDWHSSSFGDGPAVSGVCVPAVSDCTYAGILNDPNLRYIEVMYRRGYTKGCGYTNDNKRKFCGGDYINRAQLATFLIRAKMNNVFPTSLSGIPLVNGAGGSAYGDNFGIFTPSTPYFSDITSAATDPFADYWIYVQKMRELRITNGIGGGLYGPGVLLTRKEIAVFVVRAFFL